MKLQQKQLFAESTSNVFDKLPPCILADDIKKEKKEEPALGGEQNKNVNEEEEGLDDSFFDDLNLSAFDEAFDESVDNRLVLWLLIYLVKQAQPYSTTPF